MPRRELGHLLPIDLKGQEAFVEDHLHVEVKEICLVHFLDEVEEIIGDLLENLCLHFAEELLDGPLVKLSIDLIFCCDLAFDHWPI